MPYDLWLARLETALQPLADKPEETAESTLRALWLTAAGTPVSAVVALHANLPHLSESQCARLEDLIRRRVDGVPLAHLTGRQHFMGLEFIAGPDALVPRQETEILARTAIELARQAVTAKVSCIVIDVCTGSGNVALSVAHNVREAAVFGADLSSKAVQLARLNACQLGLAERVEFRVGDLAEPFKTDEFIGRVDVLACNPPYISSAGVGRMPTEISAHEPSLAFDGGPLGIGILMRLLKDGPTLLRAGGWLVFEVGLGQGPSLQKRLRTMPEFSEVQGIHDQGGHIRVLKACRRETNQ